MPSKRVVPKPKPLGRAVETKVLSRSIAVVGEIIDDLSENKSVSKGGQFLATIARFLYLIVEVTAGSDLKAVCAKHLFKLLVMCAILVLAIGFALSNSALLIVGFEAIVILIFTYVFARFVTKRSRMNLKVSDWRSMQDWLGIITLFLVVVPALAAGFQAFEMRGTLWSALVGVRVALLGAFFLLLCAIAFGGLALIVRRFPKASFLSGVGATIAACGCLVAVIFGAAAVNVSKNRQHSDDFVTTIPKANSSFSASVFAFEAKLVRFTNSVWRVDSQDE